VSHASVLSAVEANISQGVLELAIVVDGVLIRRHIQSPQTSQRQRSWVWRVIIQQKNSASQLSSAFAFQCLKYTQSKLYIKKYVNE